MKRKTEVGNLTSLSEEATERKGPTAGLKPWSPKNFLPSHLVLNAVCICIGCRCRGHGDLCLQRQVFRRGVCGYGPKRRTEGMDDWHFWRGEKQEDVNGEVLSLVMISFQILTISNA